MQEILIVTNSQSYITLSIKAKLEELSYHVTMVEGKVKEISRLKGDYGVMLIYTDDELAENQATLVYLRDQVIEKDIRLFLIGDENKMESITKVMPGHAVAKEFVRPVNVAEVVEKMNDYIEAHLSGAKKKILVVDDSGAMLRSIKGWLEDKYQVVLANSGAMAIKYLSLDRPDLVLLDYEMPVVDGKQVLEMIRTEMEFSDIPVIFLTSKNDKESVEKVVGLKPEGYLLKTMPPSEIIKNIDEFFVRKEFEQLKKV